MNPQNPSYNTVGVTTTIFSFELKEMMMKVENSAFEFDMWKGTELGMKLHWNGKISTRGSWTLFRCICTTQNVIVLLLEYLMHLRHI